MLHRSSSQFVLVALVGSALCIASSCEQPGPGNGNGAATGGASTGGDSTAGSGGQSTGNGGETANRDGNVGSGGSGNGGAGAGGTSGRVTESGGSAAKAGNSGHGGGTATGGETAAGGATSLGGAGGASSNGGNTGKSDAGDANAADGARPDGAISNDSSRDGGTTDALAADGATGSDGARDSVDDGADPPRKIKVWLAGDSTMMNCSGACPCGWGSQLQALLNSNATVVNNAVGGRSIQTWLYDPNVTSTMDASGECTINPKTYSTRWQGTVDPSNGMQPGDYLLIEFGINDGDSTCPRHVGTTLFQSYLGMMADGAKALGAQPIFLTSTSAIACSGSTAQANRGFGTQTKAAGIENDVPVIDLTVLTALYYTSIGLCPNSGDYTSTTSAVGKFFCEDHTHFESAGASQVAGVVAKALKDQGIGLAAYLK